VIFESRKSAVELVKEIEKSLPRKFKLNSDLIKILVLSQSQLDKVIQQAPKGFGSEPSKYYSDVIFLMGIPSDAAIKIFNPREGVDKIWQGDLAIYSQRLSTKRTKSRLSKIAASPLYKQMTIRSWGTTIKLLDLMNVSKE
jgi:uncharacterized protein (DUF1697 family)